VLAALALAILTVVMCFMTGVFDFSQSQTMPGVVGLTREVAVGQLRSLGISPNINYEESPEAPELVIRQSPEENRALSRHPK
jgi:beta-lactam-binding protein with PASTA domain